MDNAPQPFPSIRSLKLHGYRPFGEFLARFSALEVIVGANSSGKSSLFEFLKFLRNAVEQDIPPEIVAGSIGQQIFHRPGPDRFAWSVEIDLLRPGRLHYEGEVLGPIGQTRVSFERVHLSHAPGTHDDQTFIFMDVHGRKGYALEPAERSSPRQELDLRRPNQLALSVMTNPALATLYNLRASSSLVGAFTVPSTSTMTRSASRRPSSSSLCCTKTAPTSAQCFLNLMSEHPLVFDELKYHLRAAVPGFRNLAVKARGGPGEVIAFWQEEGGRWGTEPGGPLRRRLTFPGLGHPRVGACSPQPDLYRRARPGCPPAHAAHPGRPLP
jgi:predicted ATPase